jgi:transposase
LIADNARTHRREKLTERVGKHKTRAGLFYLPPYSPDLNPDGHLNADVKYGVGSRTPKRTKEGLGNATEEHMNMLDDNPKRITRYFLDPAIAHASNV